MSAGISEKRSKKSAEKAAAKLAAAEHGRLVARIRNLFELEGWSTEAISEAVELPRDQVIRLIQQSSWK